MRPSLVTQALEIAVRANIPVMLHGSPGVGKSDVVRQLAAKLDYELIDLRLSQLDPVDLRGVPSVNKTKKLTSWNVPDIFPPTDTKKPGILFLDEINSAPQATQAAAYQLVLDRKLGDYHLPDNWVIIAAGNKSTDQAIVNQMSTALKNRFMHIEYETSLDDWATWAFSAEVHPAVIGFVRFKPTSLNEMESRGNSEQERKRLQKVRSNNAFATPRSWERVSKLMKQDPPNSILFDMLTGNVGEGAAAEFQAYLKYYHKMPNLDEIILSPDKAPVPEEPELLFAVSSGLAARASKDNFDNIIQYLERIPSEFSVMAIKDSVNKDRALYDHPGFTKWAVTNASLLT